MCQTNLQDQTPLHILECVVSKQGTLFMLKGEEMKEKQ